MKLEDLRKNLRTKKKREAKKKVDVEKLVEAKRERLAAASKGRIDLEKVMSRGAVVGKYTGEGRDITLQFGRHRGLKLKDVESGYLRWMANEAEDEELSDAITAELKERSMARAPAFRIRRS